MSRIWRAYSVPFIAVGACALAAMLALSSGPRPCVSHVLTSAATLATGSGVLHVDDDAPAGGDGLTWRTAFRFLQDALDAAREPGSGVTEIRIAQGEYKPDQGASVTPGDTNATFAVPTGIALRGGYAGLGAPDPDARDPDQFESILSGDLLGNDPPVVWPPPPQTAQHAENSLHIMTVQDGNSDTLIEGLVFTKARLSYTIENLGGALLGIGGEPIIRDCTFRHNRAWRGGGIGLDDCDANVHRCTFHQNLAEYGGALHVGTQHGMIPSPSDATVDDCVFTYNRCGGVSGTGGAIAVHHGSAHISGSIFRNNVAPMGTNGGAISTTHSPTYIVDCDFELNGADNGGAINGNPTVLRSRFHGNAANWGGAIYSNGTGLLTCTDCVFTDNFANDQGGVLLGSGVFVNCDFDSNSVFWDSGGVVTGGGMFAHCRFTRNQSNLAGGGAVLLTLPGSFVNCLFNANMTTEQGGGAIRVHAEGDLAMIGCTLVHNEATQGPGAILAQGRAVVSNSIVWENTGPSMTGDLQIDYSCVQDAFAGEGNVTADPRFVAPLGPDGLPGTPDDDLRLRAGSPCIDAGNSFALPPDHLDLDGDGVTDELWPADGDGLARLLNAPGQVNTGLPQGPHPVIDMGCYEFRDFVAIDGDVTADGAVDIDDLLAVIQFWGPCAAPCGPDVFPREDDGEVTIQDLLMVVQSWSP